MITVIRIFLAGWKLAVPGIGGRSSACTACDGVHRAAMLGLLLIDHGSRRAESNRQLDDMAARVQRLRPDAAVAAAHMEIAPPDLTTAFAELVAKGATRIVILPYFLSDGRHLTQDIPQLATAAAAPHSGIAYTIGTALGPHDALAALLLERGGA